MGTKKTTKQTSNQTTTAAPPSWTMPGIQDVSGRVMNALNSLPGTKYTGDFFALPDSNMVSQAQQMYNGAAQTSQDLAGYVKQNLPTVGQPINYGGPNLPTGSYNIGSGQDLNPAIEAATRPIYRQLTEQALPGIRSSADAAGAGSNTRVGVLQAQALRDWQTQASDIAAEMAYKDYNDREARRLQAYGIDTNAALEGFGLATNRGLGEAGLNLDRAKALPELTDSIMRLALSGGDILMQSDATRQAAEQARINNELARNQYEWQYPFQGLDVATQLLSQLSGNWGTTTSQGESKTVEKTGGLGAVAQGIMGAASLAAGLGAFGPMGAAMGGLGAAGGAAGNLLSANGLNAALGAIKPINAFARG